jgi:hypothetical protein
MKSPSAPTSECRSRGTTLWAIRSLLALLAIMWLCSSAIACGAKTASSKSGPKFDSDDTEVLTFGAEADPADRQAITALIDRYYKVAAAANGAAGCSLLDSLQAETMAEDYGHVPRLRGTTCAVVLSKLFTMNHREITSYLRKIDVLKVRVKNNRGQVVVWFGTPPVRLFIVHREQGAWKVDSLSADVMP